MDHDDPVNLLAYRQMLGLEDHTPFECISQVDETRLAFLLARRHCDVFCLNDTDSAAVALTEQAAMLADFLPQYFPFRSPFELPDEVAEERARFSATELAAASGRPRLPEQRVPDSGVLT